MSIWGKIIGGAVGLAVGGPLGALIGAVAGHHIYDRSKGGARIEPSPPPPGGGPSDPQARQAAFASAVVVLGAKMAKADGVVTRAEVDAFKRVFKIPPENEAAVGRLFDEARASADGFEPYARQIAALFADSPQVLEDLLAALFMIARADGEAIHPAEERFLHTVAEIFGLPPRAWERMRGAGSGKAPDPYAVLEVEASASDEAVRAAYRRMLREHHPDLVQAKGLPAEFVEIAQRRMAEINAAWDTIRERRGLR